MNQAHLFLPLEMRLGKTAMCVQCDSKYTAKETTKIAIFIVVGYKLYVHSNTTVFKALSYCAILIYSSEGYNSSHVGSPFTNMLPDQLNKVDATSITECIKGSPICIIPLINNN